MSASVIFLDFDGVIVTAHDRYKSGDPWCVSQLNQLIESTGAQIVVTSMWRIGRTLEELKELLKEWEVEGECIGLTPRNWDKQRGDEIQEWLDANPTEKFVIIDDDSDMDHLMPFLVKTHFAHGMDSEDVAAALKILNAAVRVQDSTLMEQNSKTAQQDSANEGE